MKNQDIRWVQRFNSFSKAFLQLENAVSLSKERPLSKLEEQGVIQAFEYTHELAWKTIKDFLEGKGNNLIYGSKDATRAAFKLGLIENGDVWMDMVKSRNQTSHTYNEENAVEIVTDIINNYFKTFIQLHQKFMLLKEEEE
jgi:nucleotidyltransferase substrate binding protein (TIGR01987 family)